MQIYHKKSSVLKFCLFDTVNQKILLPSSSFPSVNQLTKGTVYTCIIKLGHTTLIYKFVKARHYLAIDIHVWRSGGQCERYDLQCFQSFPIPSVVCGRVLAAAVGTLPLVRRRPDTGLAHLLHTGAPVSSQTQVSFPCIGSSLSACSFVSRYEQIHVIFMYSCVIMGFGNSFIFILDLIGISNIRVYHVPYLLNIQKRKCQVDQKILLFDLLQVIHI